MLSLAVQSVYLYASCRHYGDTPFAPVRELTGTKLALTCAEKVVLVVYLVYNNYKPLPPPRLYPQGACRNRHVPTGDV